MIGAIVGITWAALLLTGLPWVEDGDECVGSLQVQFEDFTDVDELTFPARK